MDIDKSRKSLSDKIRAMELEHLKFILTITSTIASLHERIEILRSALDVYKQQSDEGIKHLEDIVIHNNLMIPKSAYKGHKASKPIRAKPKLIKGP